jgi:hypothetical protein
MKLFSQGMRIIDKLIGFPTGTLFKVNFFKGLQIEMAGAAL